MAMYANIGGANKLLAQTSAEAAGGGVTYISEVTYSDYNSDYVRANISIPFTTYFLVITVDPDATLTDNNYVGDSSGDECYGSFVGIICDGKASGISTIGDAYSDNATSRVIINQGPCFLQQAKNSDIVSYAETHSSGLYLYLDSGYNQGHYCYSIAYKSI